LTLRVLAADGLIVRGSVLDLDGAVVDPKLGAEIVSFDEHFLWLIGDDVTGEGGGLRGDGPDVKVVDIHHPWDLLEGAEHGHVVHLVKGQKRGRGGGQELTWAGTPSKRIVITRPSNEKVDL
jgi:hypothetical protein